MELCVTMLTLAKPKKAALHQERHGRQIRDNHDQDKERRPIPLELQPFSLIESREAAHLDRQAIVDRRLVETSGQAKQGHGEASMLRLCRHQDKPVFDATDTAPRCSLRPQAAWRNGIETPPPTRLLEYDTNPGFDVALATILARVDSICRSLLA